MLPSEVSETPVQETTDTAEPSETVPTAEENTSADNSGEGMISKSSDSSDSDSDSLWQIGALEETGAEQTTAAEDYRIESLEKDNTTEDSIAETEADAVSMADGTYKADDFSFSGGTGKTKITCEGITVKDGQTYATIKFSSSSFNETGCGRQRISACK